MSTIRAAGAGSVAARAQRGGKGNKRLSSRRVSSNASNMRLGGSTNGVASTSLGADAKRVPKL
jgi:hypothetical protein